MKRDKVSESMKVVRKRWGNQESRKKAENIGKQKEDSKMRRKEMKGETEDAAAGN